MSLKYEEPLHISAKWLFLNWVQGWGFRVEGGRERVCVCVCVCVRERERERERMLLLAGVLPLAVQVEPGLGFRV